ncbi:hypothetical protein CXB51_010730 [Gossypium anomalum]|uniref:SWIM-type domain-containing protein n=1 Tax=Gossypium anomalum TaxID=47600 RepID=A0A8J5YN60_9ROSI|nr:hypothetical protein CXB51_010730 [Gossypium anomalum]
MGNRKEATSGVTSTLMGLIDENFNENEENMSGSDVSSSDVSGSDSDASERFSLDGLDMDGIEVDELCDSDDSVRLESAHESDSDGQNWPEFNLENDMNNPILKVGMLFRSKDSLKEAAKQYGTLNSYFIKFPKNDLRRLKAVCNEKCSWFIWASRLNPNDPTDQTWQIRTSNPNHTCSKVYKNRNVTSAWIGEQYKEKFIADPEYSLKSLQQDVKRDFCCLVSLTKCRRAKLRALKLIEGAHKAQYEKIYEYLLEACKDGYRAGCRRIVGLDGCFLKGYYGGYLLAAVRIDANNDIYPLAYAAVESENQASWLWFLEVLAIDLEIVSSYQITFMSDKQKGLLEAICMLFPNAETRHCVRHLHSNFKNAGFRTKELKDLLWKAARASTTREFDDAMDELRKTNQHAYDWLKKKNPTHWSRSHFSIRSHSDMLVNNLFESFNKMILEARGKPILTMMETVRTKIMLLIVKKKEEADKWKGILCPKIKKKLDGMCVIVCFNQACSLFSRCVPSHAGGDKYQVECGPCSQHVVDLVQNSCSCRNWDLTGIPCTHALAVIHVKNEFPETYVQTWYTKQTQLQIYSNFVSPVRGPKQWAPLSNMLPVLPPPLRRPPGRSIKVRRKEPDEPQTTERLSKRGVEMRCSKCKIIGHNKRSCKGKVGQNIPVKRHQVGVRTQQQATPSQQEGTPTQQGAPTQLPTAPTQIPTAPTHQEAALRQKLPLKRKSTTTTVRWMPSTQESSMTDH